MLDDLLVNCHLPGKSPAEVTNLLGQPQAHEKSEENMLYLIDVKYAAIDPVYHKWLVIHFSAASLVDTCRIEEWQK